MSEEEVDSSTSEHSETFKVPNCAVDNCIQIKIEGSLEQKSKTEWTDCMHDEADEVTSGNMILDNDTTAIKQEPSESDDNVESTDPTDVTVERVDKVEYVGDDFMVFRADEEQDSGCEIGNTKHANKSTNTNDNLLCCDVCGRVCSRLDNLRRHMLIHGDRKNYQCKICDKYFTDSSTLRRHIVAHSGIKPFSCEICGTLFTRMSYKRQHLATHMGDVEKTQTCEICGKCFTQVGHLKEHMVIHSGVKKYNCEQCGKAFMHVRGVRRHRATHEDKRDHQCHKCGQLFTQAGHCKSHMIQCFPKLLS